MNRLHVETSPGKKPNEAGFLTENVDFLRSHLNYVANHAGLSGADYRVLNAVLDRTLGFRKLADRVSLSVLASKSGVARPGRSLARLAEAGILTFTSGGPGDGANTLTTLRLLVPTEGIDPMIHTHGVPSPAGAEADLAGDPSSMDTDPGTDTKNTPSRELVATAMAMTTDAARKRIAEQGRVPELEEGAASLLGAGMSPERVLFYLGLWLGKTRGEHAHLLATITMEQARLIDDAALADLIQSCEDQEAIVSAGYRQGETVRQGAAKRARTGGPVVPLFPEGATRSSPA